MIVPTPRLSHKGKTRETERGTRDTKHAKITPVPPLTRFTLWLIVYRGRQFPFQGCFKAKKTPCKRLARGLKMSKMRQKIWTFFWPFKKTRARHICRATLRRFYENSLRLFCKGTLNMLAFRPARQIRRAPCVARQIRRAQFQATSLPSMNVLDRCVRGFLH